MRVSLVLKSFLAVAFALLVALVVPAQAAFQVRSSNLLPEDVRTKFGWEGRLWLYLGIMFSERNPHQSACLNCATCDGHPGLVNVTCGAQSVCVIGTGSPPLSAGP